MYVVHIIKLSLSNSLAKCLESTVIFSYSYTGVFGESKVFLSPAHLSNSISMLP